MNQNISITELNKFAPEGFSFREDKQGIIWVENEKTPDMNYFEPVGCTSLTIESLKSAFKPFYNFTHKEKDGKFIESPLKVLPLSASESEVNKSIQAYMHSRIHDVKIDEAHLAQSDEFEKLIAKKMPSLTSYLECVESRIRADENYKNNEKDQNALKANPPKRNLFGLGYHKKLALWKEDLSSFEANKNSIDKMRQELTQKSKKNAETLTDSYYGNLFTQIVMQSALKAVEADVRKHYHHLAEQHEASNVYEKHHKVKERLKSYGASFGEVSGAVKADAMAEAKRTGSEYKEPVREDKLQKAHKAVAEKTFGGR